MVLNNRKGVSAETRKRILSVIEDYRYQVPDKKHAPEKFRLTVIKYKENGFALEENQGFIASIIDRIESECRRYAYDLVMCNCDARNAETIIRDMMLAPPNAVIFVGTELREPYYHLLDLFTVPLTVLDNNIERNNVDCVVISNKRLMKENVRYLYDLGHREIGYLRFAESVCNCDERYQGYLEICDELNIKKPETLYLKPTVDGAYSDMKRLIRSGQYVPHGAVVADNDTVAIGAMRAVIEEGFRIPEDLSIVGFDDIPFSAVAFPALTTMRISRTELATLAVDTIRKRIKYPDWPCVHILAGGKMIVRDSVLKIN